MQTIDFLPAHYRERRKQRRVRWWWALIVCMFGGVVVVTASLQWFNVQRIKKELQQLETQCAAFRQLDQQLLEIEDKVSALSHSANLYTFLKHPWPRTQILAAIAKPLPPELQLSNVRITDSLVAKPIKPASPESATAETAAPAHPAVADLRLLHDAQESQRLVVMVEGSAKEVEALHGYLEALARHPLIAEARLNSMETRKFETHSLVVFQLQLTITAGHGLSDGPAGALSPAITPPAETASREEEALR